MNTILKFTQVSASDNKKIKSIRINFLYMHTSNRVSCFLAVLCNGTVTLYLWECCRDILYLPLYFRHSRN